MSKEFEDNKESKNGTLANNNVSSNFTHLFNLLNKKDYSKLRIKIDEVLSLNIDDSITKVYAKLLEIFLNLEENKIPSFVLLAPFGEVCENIKKLLKDNKINESNDEANISNILTLGKDLYDKFFNNLTNLNEGNLLNILKKYESIFLDYQINNSKNHVNINVSQRTKEYIEEVTLSKQFTNNNKRKKIFWCALFSLIVFGIVVICVNETFEFRKIIKPDYISLEKIDLNINKINPEVEKIERTKIDDKSIIDGLKKISFDSQKSNKNLFSLGMYEIVKSAPVRIAPSKDAKIIGKFNVGNKIKVVGKEGKFYKIASKDNKSFGYVPIKFCKFIINNK